MPSEAPTHAERLARIRRPADYPLTILLINPINRVLVGPVHRLGISPNVITALSFGVGVVAAWALREAVVVGGWARIAAPLLVFAAHTLDALDGDVARYGGTRSVFGAAIDPTLDRVRELLYVGAVGCGLVTLGDADAWVPAMLCGAAVLLYYYTVDAHVSRVMGAFGNDLRRHAVTGGEVGGVRVKFGLYEPFMYGLALATSAGFGSEALWVLAALFALGWAGQLVKLYRASRRAQEDRG